MSTVLLYIIPIYSPATFIFLMRNIYNSDVSFDSLVFCFSSFHCGQRKAGQSIFVIRYDSIIITFYCTNQYLKVIYLVKNFRHRSALSQLLRAVMNNRSFRATLLGVILRLGIMGFYYPLIFLKFLINFKYLKEYLKMCLKISIFIIYLDKISHLKKKIEGTIVIVSTQL